MWLVFFNNVSFLCELMQEYENKFEVIVSKGDLNDFHQHDTLKKKNNRENFNFHHKSLLASQRWLTTHSVSGVSSGIISLCNFT